MWSSYWRTVSAMENQQEERRPWIRRRVLVGAVVGSAVLGGVLVLLPWGPADGEPPAPAPGAQALAAVTTGVPAALPDLAVLIGERESHLRKHPKDAESW